MAKRELPILPIIETSVDGKVRKPRVAKPRYDCSKCPGYCCSYDWITVNKLDIKRLAKHFNITYEQAEKRYTRFEKDYGYRVLRHKKDHIYKTTCKMFDQEERKCGVYEARPALCRIFPTEKNCGYYDFLVWEREHQDDEEFIPMYS
jgi:Fe-S-cluster containining protein